MFSRRWLTLSALLLMSGLFVLALILARSALGKVDPHQFELADGRKVSGFLMRLQPQILLLQSERECLLVSADELKKVDGQTPSMEPLPTAARVPLRQEIFERVLSSGEIELHSTFVVHNGGAAPLAETNWGLGAHEFGFLRDYHVIDEFGSDLVYRVVDEPERNGKRVVVALRRPALPGEELRLTTVIGNWAQVANEGGERLYRMAGDYPDDRLVTRTVLLPKEARIVSVEPPALYQSQSAEGPVVTWRRYFLRGESIPWTIRYTLPA